MDMNNNFMMILNKKSILLKKRLMIN